MPEERDPRVREIIVVPYRVIYELNPNGLTVDISGFGIRLAAGLKCERSDFIALILSALSRARLMARPPTPFLPGASSLPPA